MIKYGVSHKGYFATPSWEDGTYIIGSGDTWLSYTQERGSINPDTKLYRTKREAELRYLRAVCDAHGVKY